MSTNQQERGDFAVAWHPFSLFGRWAWFEGTFKHKTRGAQRVEIRAEHAVMVCNPDGVRSRVADHHRMLRIRQGYPLSVRCLETGVRNGKDHRRQVKNG